MSSENKKRTVFELERITNVFFQGLFQQALFKKVVATIITNLFLTFISSLLYLSYMAHHHFFSYDFFTGFLGVNSFTFTLSFLLILSTIGLWGVPFWIAIKLKQASEGTTIRAAQPKNASFIMRLSYDNYLLSRFILLYRNLKFTRFDYILLIILGLISYYTIYYFHEMIVEKPNDARTPEFAEYLILLTLIVAIHMVVLFVGNFQSHLISIVVLSILIPALSFSSLYRQEARIVITSILKIYYVGGHNVHAKICRKFDMIHDKRECIVGPLVLLSPEHVYLDIDWKKDGIMDTGVTTFKRKDFEAIYVFKR